VPIDGGEIEKVVIEETFVRTLNCDVSPVNRWKAKLSQPEIAALEVGRLA
jgi:hypothetical protein